MKRWLRAGASSCFPNMRSSGLYVAPLSRVSDHRVDRAGISKPCVSIHTAATVLGIALSLSACQTPAIKDRVVEVSVPIATHPVKPEQVPQVPAPLGPRPQSLSAAADVLMSKVCQLEAYALKADPLLRVSAGIAQQPLRFPECEGR